MSGNDVELDGASEHGTRKLSALLSAALAAAQAMAQRSAEQARQQAAEADRQSRDQQRQLDALTRQEQAQIRAQDALRQRQWNLKPTAEWLRDNPLSAASAWAAADTHRNVDPVAARHAEQWEAIFTKEGINLADVRANAAAAVTEPGKLNNPTVDQDAASILVAEEAAAAAVIAGAVDVAREMDHHTQSSQLEQEARAEQVAAAEQQDPAADQVGAPAEPAAPEPDLRRQVDTVLADYTAQPDPTQQFPDAQPAAQSTPGWTAVDPQWTAYADGDPVAALGGMGVSTPPSQLLAKVRARPDIASVVGETATVQAQLATTVGVER